MRRRGGGEGLGSLPREEASNLERSVVDPVVNGPDPLHCGYNNLIFQTFIHSEIPSIEHLNFGSA